MRNDACGGSRLTEMTLESFLSHYGSVLKKRMVCAVRGNPVECHVQELALLGEMTSDLATLLREVREPLKNFHEHASLLHRTVHFVAERAREIYEAYGPPNTIISDDTYGLLSWEADGTSNLELLAAGIARIDNSFSQILGRRIPAKREKGKAKDYSDKINANDAQTMRAFIDTFTCGKQIAGPRELIVKAVVRKRIDDVRAKYVKLRAGYEEIIADYETRVMLLRDADAPDELLTCLGDWNPGAAYKKTRERLAEETGILASEQSQFLDRLDEAKKEFCAVYPSFATLLGPAIKERSHDLTTRLEGIFSGATPDRDLETSILRACDQLLELTKTFQSEEFKDLIKDVKRETGIKSFDNLRRPIEVVRTHVGYYRLNKERLIALAKVAREKKPILSPDSLFEYAQVYNAIYGLPSWKNAKARPGAYKVAERLRKEFLDQVDHQLSHSLQELRTAYQEAIEAEGPAPEALLSRVSKLREVIDLFTTVESRQNLFFSELRRLPALKSVVASLDEPTAALEIRDRLRQLGQARLEQATSDDIGALFSSYKERCARITAVLVSIGNGAPFAEYLHQFGERTLAEIDRRVFHRVKGFLLYASPEDENIRALSDRKLLQLAAFLEQTAMHAARTSLDGELSDILDPRLDACRREVASRKTFIRRTYRWISERLWGSGPEKYFILDTNVLLHNPNAITTFGSDNAVVILQEVIQELDRKKTSDNQMLAFAARQANRALVAITERAEEEYEGPDDQRRPQTLGPGIIAYNLAADGSGTTVIFYDQNSTFRERAISAGPQARKAQRFMEWVKFQREIMDETIIHGALSFRRSIGRPLRQPKTVFVCKDNNARLRARSSGLEAQDYKHDKVGREIGDMPTGWRYLSLPESLQRDAQEGKLTPLFLTAMLELASDADHIVKPKMRTERASLPIENEFIIWRHPENYARTMILRFADGKLRPLSWLPEEAQAFPLEYFARHPEKGLLGKVVPRSIKQVAALELLLDPKVELVTIEGRAGSGKTFLCTAAYLSMLSQGQAKYPYSRVYLTKPLYSIGPTSGALPGDIDDKLAPWYQSFYGHLQTLIGTGGHLSNLADRITTMQFEHMRGLDVTEAVRWLDEAQGAPPDAVKTFISRSNEPTKTLLTGDGGQIDNPRLDAFSNGFAHVRLAFIGEPIYGHITFTRSERGRLAALAEERLPYRGGRF